MSGLIYEWRSRRGKLVKNDQGAWILPKETPWKCYAAMKGLVIYQGDIPLSRCENIIPKHNEIIEEEDGEEEEDDMYYEDDDEYENEEEYEIIKG